MKLRRCVSEKAFLLLGHLYFNGLTTAAVVFVVALAVRPIYETTLLELSVI